MFWVESIHIAIYIINRIPSTYTLGKSPYEMLFGQLPDYSSLQVFGCTCFILKPHVERDKLSSKSDLCVFMGYGIG